MVTRRFADKPNSSQSCGVLVIMMLIVMTFV